MWHIYHICQEIVSIHKVSFIFIESLSCRPIDLRTDEHNELRKAALFRFRAPKKVFFLIGPAFFAASPGCEN